MTRELAERTRKWKCPDCGRELSLSVTQLDPVACDECLARLKGSPAASVAAASGITVSPPVLIAAACVLLAVGGLLGLVAGFAAARILMPAAPASVSDGAKSPASHPQQPPESPSEPKADTPDESTRPGPGYRWVRGYTRKDGVKVKGHWARDPSYERQK